jgi:hypothetical protein
LKLLVPITLISLALPATAAPASRPDPWSAWPVWNLVSPALFGPIGCDIDHHRILVQCESDDVCTFVHEIQIGPGGCPSGLAFDPRDISPGSDRENIEARRESGGEKISEVPCPEPDDQPQGRVCFEDLAPGTKAIVRHTTWTASWDGRGPMIQPGLEAKHPWLGAIGKGNFAGVNLRMPRTDQQPREAYEVEARGSWRFDYRLTVWNQPIDHALDPGAAEDKPPVQGFEQAPALLAAFGQEHGNPVEWKVPQGYRHIGIHYEKSPFGFAGLTLELGASRVGLTWAGLGRIGADFWLLDFLYTSLQVEASTIGDLGLAAEVVAAGPNFAFVVPSMGFGLGVVGDFMPDAAMAIRTRLLLQWPMIGFAVGFDWRVTPSTSRRFHLALTFGF